MSNQPEVEPSRAFKTKILKGKFVKKQNRRILRYPTLFEEQTFKLEAKKNSRLAYDATKIAKVNRFYQ